MISSASRQLMGHCRLACPNIQRCLKPSSVPGKCFNLSSNEGKCFFTVTHNGKPYLTKERLEAEYAIRKATWESKCKFCFFIFCFIIWYSFIYYLISIRYLFYYLILICYLFYYLIFIEFWYWFMYRMAVKTVWYFSLCY